MMARRLAKTGACVCLLCAGPILGSRQIDTTQAVSRLQSRSTSGSSTHSTSSNVSARQNSVWDKLVWHRLSKEPEDCPKFEDKNLTSALRKHRGQRKITLTTMQAAALSCQSMCWDTYVQVDSDFYRPVPPTSINEGVIHEMRLIGLSPATSRLTLRRVPAQQASKNAMAWRRHDADLLGTTFSWAAPLVLSADNWNCLTRHCIVHVPEDTTEPCLLCVRGLSGCVKTRAPDGSVQIKFASQRKLLHIHASQATHIKAHEPILTWTVSHVQANAQTKQTAVRIAPYRLQNPAHTRSRYMDMATLRSVLADQERWRCGEGVDKLSDHAAAAQTRQAVADMFQTFTMHEPQHLEQQINGRPVRAHVRHIARPCQGAWT